MTLSTTRSATAERSFYLIVRGEGSWGGGDPLRTYRAGVHEVSVAVAEAVLTFKEKHPKASWLLSDVRPELEDGSLVRLLWPEDLQPGATPDGVRLLREDEQAGSGPGNEKNGAEAPPLVYACQFCPARFPSAAAAKRHLRHNHVLQPEKVEARVRAQLEAERE
ncbi:MAG: hypothetical protein ACR2M2_03510 [Gaiellaceae bacterium]